MSDTYLVPYSSSIDMVDNDSFDDYYYNEDRLNSVENKVKSPHRKKTYSKKISPSLIASPNGLLTSEFHKRGGSTAGAPMMAASSSSSFNLMEKIFGAPSQAHGSYSSNSYGCDNGVSIGLLITTLLGIAVMFYTLYTKVTMAMMMRRRKRNADGSDLSMEDILEDTPLSVHLNHFNEVFYNGMGTYLDRYLST